MRHRRQATEQAGLDLGVGHQLVGRDLGEVFFDPVKLLRHRRAHIRFGAGLIRDHVGAITRLEHGEVDGGFLFFIAQLAELENLVRHFGGSIATQFRRNACMRGLALDFDQRSGRTLAPHHQPIGRATWLQVQRDIVLPGGFLDQLGGDHRAGFLAGVEQHSDLRVVGEFQVMQDLQCIDSGNNTALVVHHAGAVGTTVLDVKRPLGRRAFLEHGVHVCHQQNLRLAGAFQGGNNMIAGLRCVRHKLDGCTELFQLFNRNVADLGQARHITGTRIDVDQTLEQLQGLALVLLGIGLNHLVRFGHDHRRQRRQHKSEAQMSSKRRAGK